MQSLLSSQHRKRTLFFLGFAVVCATSAALVGIDDNPAGIALVMLSAAGLVLSVVHPWRTPAQFRRLTLGAVGAFFGLMALGIALSVPPDVAVLPAALESVMRIGGTACLLAAGFLGIPAFVVGLGGWFVTRRRELQA